MRPTNSALGFLYLNTVCLFETLFASILSYRINKLLASLMLMFMFMFMLMDTLPIAHHCSPLQRHDRDDRHDSKRDMTATKPVDAGEALQEELALH